MTLGIVIEQLTELLGEASQRERPLAAVAIIAGRGVALYIFKTTVPARCATTPREEVEFRVVILAIIGIVLINSFSPFTGGPMGDVGLEITKVGVGGLECQCGATR